MLHSYFLYGFIFCDISAGKVKTGFWKEAGIARKNTSPPPPTPDRRSAEPTAGRGTRISCDDPGPGIDKMWQEKSLPFILVRKYLGVESIDLMIGGSIGGFQALEWMIMEPEVMKKALVSACGARVTPWVTAYNESQRMALEADPTFRKCESLAGGQEGLRCARAIALISYRNYICYNETQSEADPDKMFADKVCSYQQYQGKKLIDRFDAYSYYCLTYSLDSHNVGRGRGGVEAALGKIKADTVVVGIDTDCLFPVQEQKYMATHIGGAVYAEINSKFGHDGFLIESGPLGNIIQQLLDF